MFHTRFNRIVSNVIIVGCGGTGSRLIPMVAQFMKSCPAILDPFITLIDGDDVELKNLTRQNFIRPDIGRNKAMVLAERYGGAIDIPIMAIPEYYKVSDGHLAGWLNQRYQRVSQNNRHISSPIIFFAVDSMEVRLEILSGILQSRNRINSWDSVPPIIVDAGNENTFGQVSVYHATVVPGAPTKLDNSRFNTIRDSLRELGNIRQNYVGGDVNLGLRPAPVERMLQAIESPSEADVSCADLDQTAAINAQMAVGMFTAFQNICLNHKMSILDSFFDIHNGNGQTKIDEFLGGIGDVLQTYNSTYVNRIKKVLKGHDSRDTMAETLANWAGNGDHDVYLVALKEAKKAIRSNEITKRNLELEALLNGGAAKVA